MKQTTIISRAFISRAFFAMLVAVVSCKAAKADKAEIDNISAPEAAKQITEVENTCSVDVGITADTRSCNKLTGRDSNIPLTRSRASTDDTLAVEGRTWWYTSVQGGVGNVQDFGITIGEEVTINDEKWHKVNVCMYTEPYEYSSTERTIKTDSTTIAYIKDDGRNVSAMSASINPTTIVKALKYNFELWDQPFNLYSFGNVGDDNYYGVEDYSIPYSIETVDEISNTGYDYKYYRADP